MAPPCEAPNRGPREPPPDPGRFTSPQCAGRNSNTSSADSPSTIQFLETASEECLDFRPGAEFVTVREQAAHLSEVQGVYQLVLRGEEPGFDRKAEFTPTSTSREAVMAALGARDSELVDVLDSLRPVEDRFQISWYGNDMTIAGFGSVFIQHESLHHGQWAAHAALGGFDRPIGWLLNWGL